MALAIIGTLAYVVPLSSLSSFSLFGLLYAIMVKFQRRRLMTNSETISRESIRTIRHLQEGLGGIRDILLDRTQENFVYAFRRTDANMRAAQRDNNFLSASPRHLIEAAGMVLIAMIAYQFTRGDVGVTGVIPMLAALALGLQRLLPALQQLYQSISTIHGSEESLREMMKLLGQRLPSENAIQTSAPLNFTHEIRIESLGFRYGPDSPWILDNLDIVIPKGARIGFIGETGCGKSTLLDIVMGLLHPTHGALLVDGVAVTVENVSAWQSHIAHVPQDIFLTDGSVRENIAFGEPPHQISAEAVRSAARLGQIATTIESWADGYDTVVGERGVQLSGGQRQRIGIARALYKKADVIVFDEATSALDTTNEEAVMAAIDQLDKRVTVLIIAHRHTTLKNCDRIIELKKVNIHQPSTSAE
jgi:ATP-binding cassette subfamily B protein